MHDLHDRASDCLNSDRLDLCSDSVTIIIIPFSRPMMIGKRVLARLQGKTLGACHKCGASLKRGRSCLLRANHCVRCKTSYHTYDCGNRMAAVLLADNPAECPKVRGTSVSPKNESQLAFVSFSYPADNFRFDTVRSLETCHPFPCPHPWWVHG